METKMTIEQIARVAHEVNRAYCEAIGDDSQTPWEDAPDWQRESAIAGVEAHRDNPDMTPEDSHDSWLEQKAKDYLFRATVHTLLSTVIPVVLDHTDVVLEAESLTPRVRGIKS